MISTAANLLARRDLIRELVASELRSSTAQTRLGWLWWLLDPLIMMLVYWAIVVGIFGRGRVEYAPYWLFIFFGLLTWKHFSNAAGRATTVLSRKQSLIRSVPFPAMVLPISIVLSGMIFFLFGFAMLLTMMLVAPPQAHSGDVLPIVQVPLLMLIQVLLITGIALPLSSLGVLYRDLGEIVPHVLRAGFYLSPALYGVDLVHRAAVEQTGEATGHLLFTLYMANPFAILITGYRESIFYGRFMEGPYWIALILITLLVCIPGYMIFRHFERRVVKFL